MHTHIHKNTHAAPAECRAPHHVYFRATKINDRDADENVCKGKNETACSMKCLRVLEFAIMVECFLVEAYNNK